MRLLAPILLSLATVFQDASVVAEGAVREPAQARPNVITLLVDDLGYRDLGCYGGPVKTPVLDRLAAEGVRFTDFHSGAPTCSPSRATFLTGRQNPRTGVYSVLDERFHRMHLLESETTIAELLGENGYTTAHFGKWHLGMPVQNRDHPTPAEHGFDYWFGLVNGPGPSHKNPTQFLRNGKRVGKMEGYSCQIVVDEAITWLDQNRDADEPFFLNLWFNEPHDPIAAPDEIVAQYGALDEREAIYSGTIDNTDRAIGRLVARLEELGEIDNTIIIYSSDNGSYLQERNGELRGKKGALFEGGHRVPGIFYWKGGIPGGRVEDEPAGAVDLLPTLCGLIGIEKPEGVHLDGSDLAPLLTGGGNFERHQPLFWMSDANMVMRVGDHTLFASSTARSPIDFKTADRLMEQVKEVLGDDLEKELGGMNLRSRMFNGNFGNPEANRLRAQFRKLFYFQESWIPELKKSELGRVQLYDLSNDLGQQENIALKRSGLAARLKEQAAAIYRSVMADAPEWLTPKEQAAAKKPQEKIADRPATGARSTEDAKLLARIDKNPLPEGYHGSRHQAYVDRVMATLKPEQRARVGRLWKEKRRLDPDMPNPGASFVRILTHVAGDVRATDPTDNSAGAKARILPAPEEKLVKLPREPIETLVDASCIDCHDDDTETALNFDDLTFDLADADAFRKWEKVYDMIESGEMPPEKKPRPNPNLKDTALKSLHQHLRDTSLARMERDGRAPVRRLTRTEYEHTLHDLLGIGGDLASKLPPESMSSTFDTIALDQGISPVHIRSYLATADAAIDEVIELGPKPAMKPRLIDYRNHPYVQMWFERELRRGGNTVLRTADAFVMFDNRPQRSPHTTQSNHMGIRFPAAGRYRIEAEAYAYQAKTPVTFCLYRANDLDASKELIGSWQLDPGKPRQVEVEHYFKPGDFFFLAPSDLDASAQGRNVLSVGAKNYTGEGVAIRRLTLEGPLEKQWPPERTRDLLGDVEFRAGRDGKHAIILSDTPLAQVTDVVSRIGSQALRRPLEDDEVASWSALAKPVLAEGRGFEAALRVVLRAMFSSPEFLYHRAEPGPLDDYALATRLSYFLWKSLPDDQLFLLASEGKLSDPAILASEVDRLLDDERSQRFVEDFLDQWLELEDIGATTPDEKLYPEYDDVLRQAMLEETRRFFSELIWNDRGVREFIDSDFTFLNRRLAQHYGIPDIDGLEFRKVKLPVDSPRGGLLTQASILKVTANGTNTSPVPRGSFVLANLLGTPPSPPPPGAGAVEPDTRGSTTIREELAAHRSVESCNRCHREIDPPGFALESFNPIGGFRTRYRSTERGGRPAGKLFGRPIREYRLGPAVDASGMTPEGEPFAGIREFKRLLLKKEDQVARHFLNQLIAYSTGAEIQFADRDERDRILGETRGDGYGVRGMIHAVVQSKMFRNK